MIGPSSVGVFQAFKNGLMIWRLGLLSWTCTKNTRYIEGYTFASSAWLQRLFHQAACFFCLPQSRSADRHQRLIRSRHSLLVLAVILRSNRPHLDIASGRVSHILPGYIPTSGIPVFRTEFFARRFGTDIERWRGTGVGIDEQPGRCG